MCDFPCPSRAHAIYMQCKVLEQVNCVEWKISRVHGAWAGCVYRMVDRPSSCVFHRQRNPLLSVSLLQYWHHTALSIVKKLSHTPLHSLYTAIYIAAFFSPCFSSEFPQVLAQKSRSFPLTRGWGCSAALNLSHLPPPTVL